MSVQKMNLVKTPRRKAAGSKISDFALGKERRAKVEDVLKETINLEFWSPKYQAWRKLLEWYLSSGNDSELTKSTLLPLLEKEDWLAIPEGPMTPMYRDVMRLKNTSGSELFQDVYYKTIQDFCANQCFFFHSQRKRLIREVQAPAVYDDVMRQLLERDTYRSLMCALTLYRQKQPVSYEFKQEAIDTLASRLNDWLVKFLEEFQAIQDMLGDLSKQYSWYCDTVRDAIQRAWSTALVRTGRPDLVSVDERLSLSKDTADDLMGYLTAAPTGTGPALTDTAVFDAMYQIYYNNIADDPDNAERCFFALCIPPSKFNTMVDYLYDFYWCVADGLLSSALHARIVVAYQKNKDSLDPGDYLASLYYRGYPELK